MEDLLISILEKLEYDVIKQGTLDIEQEIPSAFFTYWNWDSPRDKYYDNKYNSVTYYYQIKFYSNDIRNIDVVDKAVELLEQHGFNIEENPIDDYSDIPNYKCKSFEVNYEKGGNRYA